MSTQITTDRLVLRPVEASDAARIADLVNDPRVYRMVARIPRTRRWLRRLPGLPVTLQGVERIPSTPMRLSRTGNW